jgi:hypothetical protein
VRGQLHNLAVLPRKEGRYTLNRRFSETHSWSGRLGDFVVIKQEVQKHQKCFKLEVLPDVTLYQLVTVTGIPCHAKRLDFVILKKRALTLILPMWRIG